MNEGLGPAAEAARVARRYWCEAKKPGDLRPIWARMAERWSLKAVELGVGAEIEAAETISAPLPDPAESPGRSQFNGETTAKGGSAVSPAPDFVRRAHR